MRVELLVVPYDSGLRGVRMGAGPEHLLALGLAERLQNAGHDVAAEMVELPDHVFAAEASAGFALNRLLDERVRAAADSGSLPIVLAGNCLTAVGTMAGLGGSAGVIWLDAHGDFNTPATTLGGFLDGMALATVTGRCWEALAATVPGFQRVPEESVLLIGARALDPAETDLLAESGVTRIAASAISTELAGTLVRQGERIRDVYVHVDLDVLDPGEGRANGFATPGGLSLDELLAAIDEIASRCRIRAAAVTAYDPAYDDRGRIGTAALAVVAALARGSAAGTSAAA